MAVALVLAALVALGWAMRATRRPLATHLVLLRFPLGVALLLVALPRFGRGAGAALLGNLFALDPVGQAAVAALAVVAGWVAVATAELLLRYGGERLNPAPAAADSWTELRPSPRALGWLARSRPLLAGVLAAPSLIAVTRASWPATGALAGAGAMAAGVALAILLLLAAALLVERLSPPGRDPRVLPGLGGRLERWLDRAAPRWVERVLDLFRWLGRRELFGPGYLDYGRPLSPARDGTPRFDLLPGHVTNVGLFLVATLLYLGIGALQYPGWSGGAAPGAVAAELAHLPLPGTHAGGLLAPWFPAYGYLLLVLVVLGWLLPGLSFFLDRFRIPVAAPLVLVWAIGFSLSGGDHFFALAPAPAAPTDATPAEAALAPAVLGAGGPVVAVAAAGGGITSARWTAEVLTRLGEDPVLGAPLLDRLRVVSAVSGGALGTLYFVDRLGNGRTDGAGPLRAEAGHAIRRAAGAPSLDQVTWGLAYPDLVRGLFAPVASWLFPRIDRSWALETTWARRLEPGTPPTLASWRGEALRGRLPVVVFNATVVETGERFQFSNLRLGDRPGVGSFWREFEGYDLPAVTATRLSATFPIVSMAARALPPRGGAALPVHFVDGGYYDNSGVLSLLELLEDALERQPAAVPRPPIVLLRIRAFDATAAELAQAPRENPWLVSILSPLTTVARVRGATQVFRNAFEAELFRAKWRARGVPVYLVDVPLRAFGPLSWKLTAAERCAIGDSWRLRWAAARAANPCLALLDGLLVPGATRPAGELDALEAECRARSEQMEARGSAPAEPCQVDPDQP